MKIKKIKTTLLIFMGLIVLSFAVFALAQENSSTDKNIFLDSDQDGLTNEEEKSYGTNPDKTDTDGDGYSDGVEVRSGYDPLKPGPGDKIISDADLKEGEVAGSSTEKDISQKDTNNLTDELSAKVITLLNQGDAANIKVEDIDSMIQETTEKELTFDDLPEIDEQTIRIKEQNYSSLSDEDRTAKEKEDALKYLTSISYIMTTNSPQKISSTKDIGVLSTQIISAVQNFSFESGDLTFFDNLLGKENDILKQLQEVEVPEKFLDIHKRGLQLATYANSLRSEVKIDPTDPIKSMTYLSKASGLISLSNSFFGDITSSLEKCGISEIPLSL